MPISSEDIHRALEGPGWSMRGLARHLEIEDGTMRRIGRGSRPASDNLSAWLQAIGAMWSAVPAELYEVARQMGVDHGKFVRRPRGFRPLTDEEAAQLEVLAAFHRAIPLPIGWKSADQVRVDTVAPSPEDQPLDAPNA